MSLFCWTHDPRVLECPKLPFIPRPYQDDYLLGLADAIGHHDLLAEKSRDEGASWCMLAAFFWRWLFFPGLTFILMSRKMDYVDKRGVPACMFFRLDYLLKNLPKWLQPSAVERTMGHMANLDNESTMDGESTTRSAGAGGRATAVGIDEFALFEQGVGFEVLRSITSTSESRIFNSTHQGEETAFHKMYQSPDVRKVRLPWWLNEKKNPGLYTAKDGTLEVLDLDYEFPEDFPFILDATDGTPLDGRYRSPWYDFWCRKLGGIPWIIATELDMDPGGSVSRPFPEDLLQRVKIEHCLPPIFQGEIDYTETTGKPLQVVEHARGKWKFWVELRHEDGDAPDKDMLPADRKYVMGVDIATGSGASNSVIAVYDRKTNEKVAEFADAYTRPEALAVLTCAAATLFHNAFVVPERNGPGETYVPRLLETGYRSIYRQHEIAKVTRKVSPAFGFYTTRSSKRPLYNNLREAMAGDQIINRSAEAVTECGRFIFGTDGTPVHSRAVASQDSSGANDNHGDRCTADACAWIGLKERPQKEKPKKVKIHPDSFAARFADWKREKHHTGQLVRWTPVTHKT